MQGPVYQVKSTLLNVRRDCSAAGSWGLEWKGEFPRAEVLAKSEKRKKTAMAENPQEEEAQASPDIAGLELDDKGVLADDEIFRSSDVEEEFASGSLPSGIDEEAMFAAAMAGDDLVVPDDVELPDDVDILDVLDDTSVSVVCVDTLAQRKKTVCPPWY